MNKKRFKLIYNDKLLKHSIIDNNSGDDLSFNQLVDCLNNYEQQLAEKEDFIKTLGFKNDGKFREYVLNCLLNKEDKVNRIRELEQRLTENAQHTEQLLKENTQLKKDLEAEYNSGFVWEGEARTAWDELKKKDKEIEYLKRKWAITKDCLKRKEEELPHHDKKLCHQICEKIKANSLFYTAKIKGVLYAVMKKDDLKYILDQIEKGE